MPHVLTLNQALDMRTGAPTGRDHLGRTPLQALDSALTRLENAVGRLVTNANPADRRDWPTDDQRLQQVLADLDAEEVTDNSNLTKVWDTAGSPRIIDLDQIMHAYLLNDAVHLVLPGQPAIAIPRSEAIRVGLDFADAEPRNPKPPKEAKMNSALPMPTMHYHDQSQRKTRLVANIVEPCCNDQDQTNIPPTLEFGFAEELPAGPQFASYGRDDGLGDVLPMPTMTY